MGNLEDYAKSERALQNAKKIKQKHPTGWEPRVDTDKKTIVSRPQTKAGRPEDHRWDKYLEDLGFNPDDFEIIEPSHQISKKERSFQEKSTPLGKVRTVLNSRDPKKDPSRRSRRLWEKSAPF